MGEGDGRGHMRGPALVLAGPKCSSTSGHAPAAVCVSGGRRACARRAPQLKVDSSRRVGAAHFLSGVKLSSKVIVPLVHLSSLRSETRTGLAASSSAIGYLSSPSSSLVAKVPLS